MKVIARNGDRAYLLRTSDGRARVLEIEGRATLYPPQSIGSIVSRGYWRSIEPDVDTRPIEELAWSVAANGRARRGVGWDQREAVRELDVEVAVDDLRPTRVFPLLDAADSAVMVVRQGNSSTFLAGVSPIWCLQRPSSWFQQPDDAPTAVAG